VEQRFENGQSGAWPKDGPEKKRREKQVGGGQPPNRKGDREAQFKKKSPANLVETMAVNESCRKGREARRVVGITRGGGWRKCRRKSPA